MTWENIVHHVGTIYWHDISNKLQIKTKASIPKTEYTEDVHLKHKKRVEILNIESKRLSESREVRRVMLNQAVECGNYPESHIKLAILENEIYEATYKASIDLEIHLTDAEKTEHDNAWHTYRERTSSLEKHRGKAFSMVRGKYMQVLLEK